MRCQLDRSNWHTQKKKKKRKEKNIPERRGDVFLSCVTDIPLWVVARIPPCSTQHTPQDSRPRWLDTSFTVYSKKQINKNVQSVMRHSKDIKDATLSGDFYHIFSQFGHFLPNLLPLANDGYQPERVKLSMLFFWDAWNQSPSFSKEVMGQLNTWRKARNSIQDTFDRFTFRRLGGTTLVSRLSPRDHNHLRPSQTPGHGELRIQTPKGSSAFLLLNSGSSVHFSPWERRSTERQTGWVWENEQRT